MNIAGVYGDPHMVTFDDVEYTFNGKGEFVLVKSKAKNNNNIEIQGRFDQMDTNLYGEVRATQLTSVVDDQNMQGHLSKRQKNPKENANICSFLTFGYTYDLFKKGIRGNLQESDIYEVPKSCGSKKCGDKIENEWKYCTTLMRLLWKRFGLRYSIYTAIHLTWTVLNGSLQPYAISRFISYYEKNQTSISKTDAYYYAGLVMFLSLFRCVWIQNYFLLECTLGLQIRASLTSLIYRKVLRLRPEAFKSTSVGNIVTILTKDIRSIESTMWPLSDVIIGSAEVITYCSLVYTRMGNPALIAVAFLVLGIIIQALLSRMIIKVRLKIGKMADRRLQLTQEALTILKIIKMYTWELFFEQKICQARKKEMKTTMKSFYLNIILITIGYLVSKMVFPILILTYISMGYTINTELVFYIMSLFKDIGRAVGGFIPMGLYFSAEFYASVTRIAKVLEMDELQDDSNSSFGSKMIETAKATDIIGEEHILLDKEPQSEHNSNLDLKKNVKIELANASVAVGEKLVLKNVSLTIEHPGLYIISGPLGMGKSTLLKSILTDYPVSQGTLKTHGKISYASQDPWLFPSTVKQNIVFGQHFCQSRYSHVINVCSLQHDFNVLQNGDETVIIDGGMNLSKGQQARVNLARAVYMEADIYLLDDPLAGLDVKVQKNIFDSCIRGFLKDKVVLLVTQNSRYFRLAKKVICFANRTIESIIKPEEIFEDHELDQQIVNEVLPEVTVKKETNQTQIYHEDKHVGTVNFNNYFTYLKFGGGVFVLGIIISVFVGAQFTESISDKLVTRWVDYQQDAMDTLLDSQTNATGNKTSYDEIAFTRDTIFNFYIIMIGVSIALDLIKAYLFLNYCRKASVRFHQTMCHSVLNSDMGFLEHHFIGNILNRFSYDLNHIDEVFPFLFMEVIKTYLSIAGILILIVSVNWMFLLIALVFFGILYVLRMLYIPTARTLKRLGAMTRSPLIGHLNASVEGLTTIRALKAENVLKDEFDRHQDLAISTYFMEITTARAFGFALDFAGAIFVVSVILTFLFIDTNSSVGNVGLALTQVFNLTGTLKWAIRVWAELEQCMTSVERVLEYTGIQQEDQSGRMLNHWPREGAIRFDNVNLEYSCDVTILKNICFCTNPREKIAIVGRTGAGKSSIISTLFRLYKYQGKIFIDNVDISHISLNFLRKNISIIPQDPVIFNGSIRSNIDPNQQYLDKDIWHVLKKVEIKDLIPNLDENILNLNLSTGQKQLISLARAFIKKNKIVVLDEPTANLDKETDELVHNLIKENFEACSVIVIAHRLSSILDCDKVIVMDNGSLLEMGSPMVLLAKKDSLFHKMVKFAKLK